MKLNILSGKIAWFGKHSGYEAITGYYPKQVDVSVVSNRKDLFGRIIGKILQVFFKWQITDPQESYAELRFLRKSKKRNVVGHILYIEGHVSLIEKVPAKNRQLLIGTIHLPIAEWSEQKLALLHKFEHVIILYREEIAQFQKYIPLNKIHFIHHGVGIEFFIPGDEKKVIKNKVLIVGHYLRNFEMLYKVYKAVTKTNNENLEFHIVIPVMFRSKILELVEMAKNENVFFHQNLTDEELLEQYQNSNALLIPMNDSGANTAIVQALATGLPVITTDVGGIRSYGGGNIFPVVENNNVDEMVVLFNNYFDDPIFRNRISKKQRDFAVEYLDWKIIAQKHCDFYQSVQQ